MAFKNQDNIGWESKNERGWLKLCFNTENKPIVKKIKFKARVLGTYIGNDSGDHWQINQLTFEGSNDDINWTILATINTNPDGTYPTITQVIKNDNSYKYYRFYNSESEYGGLSNVHLYTK